MEDKDEKEGKEDEEHAVEDIVEDGNNDEGKDGGIGQCCQQWGGQQGSPKGEVKRDGAEDRRANEAEEGKVDGEEVLGMVQGQGGG